MQDFTRVIGIGLLLPLAACGSGSGVSSTTAPPAAAAPAAAPSNSTLTSLVASQSFANDAGTSNVVLNNSATSSTAASASGGKSTLTISYDAPSKSYTVSVAGRSQTFAPANIITSIENDGINYRKSDAATRDTLTLDDAVKTTYKYVGRGYWQRDTLGGSAQNSSFDAFTYGLPTAASAVPKTGLGSFSTDLFGFYAAPGQESKVIGGTGTMQIDFVNAVFSSSTTLSTVNLAGNGSGSGNYVTASGKLTSDGLLSGTASYNNFYTDFQTGDLNGRLYGPAGEEVGATFNLSGGGATVVGTLVGKATTATAAPSGPGQTANLTLSNLVNEQRFTDPSGSAIAVTLKPGEDFVFEGFSPRYPMATFTAADKVASASDATIRTYQKASGSQTSRVSLFVPGPANTALALTYTSFARWELTDTDPSASRTLRYATFGFKSDERTITTQTGTAHYQGLAFGQSTTSPIKYVVTGTSSFDADFGAGKYSGSLKLTGTPAGGAALDFGTYSFKSTISIAGAGNAQIFEPNAGPLDQQIGSVSPTFYGPNAEEIGADFLVSVSKTLAAPAAGVAVQGVIVARKD